MLMIEADNLIDARAKADAIQFQQIRRWEKSEGYLDVDLIEEAKEGATITTSRKHPFTSGPWHVTGDRLVYSGSDFIADCEFSGYPAGDPRIMEQQANARLIAAAPQMFHTLEQIVRPWERPPSKTTSTT